MRAHATSPLPHLPTPSACLPACLRACLNTRRRRKGNSHAQRVYITSESSQVLSIPDASYPYILCFLPQLPQPHLGIATSPTVPGGSRGRHQRQAHPWPLKGASESLRVTYYLYAPWPNLFLCPRKKLLPTQVLQPTTYSPQPTGHNQR